MGKNSGGNGQANIVSSNGGVPKRQGFIPLSVARKNDAVIAVLQDNGDRLVKITGMNRAAEMLSGFMSEELVGNPINGLLAPETSDDLNASIEYNSGGADLSAVLRRMPGFRIQKKDGEELPIFLKVFTMLTEDPTKPRYEILMRDKFRKILMDRMEDVGEADPETLLPPSESVEPALDTVIAHMEEHRMDASFGVIEIDGYDRLPYKQLISRGVAERFRDCCRLEDRIMDMGEGRFGFILFDCSAEFAKLVSNRIRMALHSNPIRFENDSYVELTASICVTGIAAGRTGFSLIANCTKMLDRHRADPGDRVYLVES